MEALPWSDMRALLRDESAGVQEKALCLLRNLLYDSHDIIQSVLQWAGGELLTEVHDKLDTQRYAWVGVLPTWVQRRALR